MQFPRAAATLLLSLVLTGCGHTPVDCPISGTVKVNGKAADGVYVIFHAKSQGNAAVASAKSVAEGKFACSVSEPGDYSVTLLWPKVTVTKEETIEGDDRLRGKYSSPQNPVTSVKVVAGQTTTAEIAVVAR